MRKLISLMVFIGASYNASGEDIELYVGDNNLRANTKPQVMLIVDTSGSMTDSESIKTPFDPTQQYQIQTPTFSDSANDYIYYVVGSPTTLPSVDSPTENRRFKADINNCSTSVSRLNNAGFYTGRIREYTFQATTGRWTELHETDGTTITIIDCEDDINLDLSNAAAPVTPAEHNINTISGNTELGYPIDGAGVPATPVYYDIDVNKADPSWGGKIVTLYTDKYLRWEQGTKLRNGSTNIGTTNNTRLEIAKRTLVNLVDSIPSVQFGLEVYNFDNGSDSDQTKAHGGRIAFGIQEMTALAKADLLDIINVDLHGSGWTPLCESYYEAYRYFAGLSVKYGDQDIDGFNNYNGGLNHWKAQPDRDTTIESGVNYVAPYRGCSKKVFVILITDGQPTNDGAANSFVTALQADSAAKAAAANPTYLDPMALMTTVGGNYLPLLAGYMSTNDINANLPGKQTAQLYTVGFSSGASGAVPLLKAAAKNGGGEFYDASDPTKLGSKLQEALAAILEINTTFTVPSVATNSFDRTQSGNAAYFAMFIPNDKASWRGNLKKLEIKDNDFVGRDGAVAIDAQGNFDPTAKTFWSTAVGGDGNDVTEGGVVEMFSKKTNNSRKVYSDLGAGTVLSTLTFANVVTSLGSAALVHTDLGVSNSAEAMEYLDWAIGIDVDDADQDASTLDYRPDLFGDPLHSKPLTLNYGGTAANQDIRIVVGTNAGALHMFKDNGATVDETWAFMPKEFFKNIKTLRDNLPSSSKVYGLDGAIAAHIVDTNGDGTINSASDKAWLFVGLRRGGSSYYALDVTDPDAKPTLKWTIKAGSGDFKELGQTWSRPQIGYSKLNIVLGVPKPVLIFGGGYSIAKDLSGPSSPDQVGRGIYMVDADSGTLLWSITPAATTGTNTQFTGFSDSIPSKIGVLDSDGDGLIDRLYTGDSGGNVFRIDMTGDDPFNTITPWTAFKLAELGGTTNGDDRRFFNAPSIVRTFFTDTVQTMVGATSTVVRQEKPYDAILIGSGDRSTPNATDTNDKFFLLQDENVVTQPFVAGAIAPALDIPTAITFGDLYDFTNNPYGGTLTNAALDALDIAVSLKSGWFHDYADAGEKSTAGAIAVNGVAYFTSFTPGASSANVCSLVDGQGSLYAVDLYKGKTVYPPSGLNTGRKFSTTPGMPDTPSLIVPSPPSGGGGQPPPGGLAGGLNRQNVLISTGGTPIPTSMLLPTSRPYQYVTEQP